MNRDAESLIAPLAADGGVDYTPTSPHDPFQAWMDLMDVVEALCPRWPDRPPSRGHDFRM